MYNRWSILAVIPARGGSKGIPHKNIINLCGKPLISYTIQSACNSKYIDDVVVSTDDLEIANISSLYGASIPFIRPKELATDVTKTVDVIIHTIRELESTGNKYDFLILLQPTAPLRTSKDVDDAIEEFFNNDCKPLVSVSEVDDHPILMRSIKGNKLDPLLDGLSTCRRQDMPKYYKVNGSIYINPINDITCDTSFNDNPIPFIMEKSHSVDIDEMKDLALAEYYLRMISND